ncbi:MAG: aspartate carbamoyltransferase [Halobacteriales archaeon]|nr:aspartate carbamoyltransferase [Halobacteriales archaeon]
MDIITTKEMSKDDILRILDRADEIEASDALDGNVLALLFFEPSTRTRMSFDSAMKRLGGRTVDMGGVESSSVQKGETLADTVRVVEGYADAIVLRHPREGSARLAAEFVDVPVINAGDGAGHHPTQTLLDLYTVRDNVDAPLGDLRVGVMGDLKYGRTVHSLALALAEFGTHITFVSPPSLRVPENVRTELAREGVEFEEVETLNGVVESLDVLYVTRIQKERFPDEKEYEKVAGEYRVTKETLEQARDDLVLMHPLPRVDEIAPEVDETEQARYFEQAHNGVPVRMAVLDAVIRGGGE